MHQELTVDIYLVGAGEFPLLEGEAGLGGRDLDVEAIPDDFGMSVAKELSEVGAGIELGPVRIVEAGLGVGGVVAAVDEPCGIEFRGLAESGGVEDGDRGLRPREGGAKTK
jgi:hypothetical protein